MNNNILQKICDKIEEPKFLYRVCFLNQTKNYLKFARVKMYLDHLGVDRRSLNFAYEDENLRYDEFPMDDDRDLLEIIVDDIELQGELCITVKKIYFD